jgi:hypothetical protein
MSVAATLSPIQKKRMQQRRRQHIATVAALLILITAWIIGRLGPQEDFLPYVNEVLPAAERVERNGTLFVAYANDGTGTETVIGYAMAGHATGYGGPLALLVGTDTTGSITGVTIISHRETPNFFRQLETRDYYAQFEGLSFADQILIGQDIDGVSGATLSAEAVAESIRQAVRGIAAGAVPGAAIPPEEKPVKFGAPEIALLGLFIVSFFLHRLKKRPTVKNYGRWLVLVTGMVVLGFIFNKPLTLANVISFLSGFWPDWRNNLYWFILIGGILLVTSIQGKNPYCSWFCPFGATQEVLASLTGAKIYQPRAIYGKLQWIQRGLSFTAIVLGLALRQPGAASYEPFGTLFKLEGSWPQWVLLVMVLFGSLVIYRPFCNYLCPLDPVVDYIGEIRHGVKNLWQQRKTLRGSTPESSRS